MVPSYVLASAITSFILTDYVLMTAQSDLLSALGWVSNCMTLFGSTSATCFFKNCNTFSWLCKDSLPLAFVTAFQFKNYRPISLLPIFSKVLEKLVLARLFTFICKNNILDAHQHGFRPLHSANSSLTDVLYYITVALDRKYVALALFIDLSKAFDSLNLNIL